jgi:hypothetical protein
MAQPMPNMNAQPYMQQMQPMAQFMGYDAQGQPVYAPYAQPQMMPQFMGYDAQGQPVYAPYAQPQMAAPMVQPAAPVAQPAAPAVQPEPEKKPLLISPMTTNVAVEEKLSLPADTEHPSVEPMTYARQSVRSQGVHVSKIEQKSDLPDFVRSAVSKSAAPQGNIFDQQNASVAVTDNIEDILSMMGEDTSAFQKKSAQNEEVTLEYQEYKPKARKSSASSKPAANTQRETERPMTKEELKRQKRLEKIDAKFKKDLAKRGL